MAPSRHTPVVTTPAHDRITPDASLRIARALGVSDRYWIDLQTNYDTLIAKITHAEQIAAVVPIVEA